MAGFQVFTEDPAVELLGAETLSEQSDRMIDKW